MQGVSGGPLMVGEGGGYGGLYCITSTRSCRNDLWRPFTEPTQLGRLTLHQLLTHTAGLVDALHPQRASSTVTISWSTISTARRRRFPRRSCSVSCPEKRARDSWPRWLASASVSRSSERHVGSRATAQPERRRPLRRWLLRGGSALLCLTVLYFATLLLSRLTRALCGPEARVVPITPSATPAASNCSEPGGARRCGVASRRRVGVACRRRKWAGHVQTKLRRRLDGQQIFTRRAASRPVRCRADPRLS